MADNIYAKIQSMRVKFQNLNVKKSGENKFAGYKYYELGDILPPINQLLLEHKCMSFVTFGKEVAKLTIVDTEDPASRVEFESPMEEASLKGAHPIQNLGAVETYQRRYLYMTAFEIVEADVLDATQNPNESKTPAPAKAKETKKLSELSSEALNRALTAYKKAANLNTKEAIKRLEKEIKKQIDDVTEADVSTVLAALDEMRHKAQLEAEQTGFGEAPWEG